MVGLVDHGDFKFVLDNAGDFNGILDSLEILVSKVEEGDIIGDLVGNGKDGRIGTLLGKLGEGRVDVGGEFDLVDIVTAQCSVNTERETRPDDIIRVDWRDEED